LIKTALLFKGMPSLGQEWRSEALLWPKLGWQAQAAFLYRHPDRTGALLHITRSD
jgi:hypothetical protein